MIRKIHGITLLLTVVSLAILPACSAANTPAQPTIDPNAIFTQAASTVQAGLTQTAAALPTATFTPQPTETAVPSPTIAPPTEAPTTDAALPTLPQPGQSGAAATQKPGLPLATTAALGQAGDHASYGSQNPADNTTFPGLSRQQVFWSLINTGTTTWTTGYKLVWVGGRQMSGDTSIPVTKDVKPGQKFDFYTILITPENKGTYTSYWKLSNPSGAMFYEVYLKYIVN